MPFPALPPEITGYAPPQALNNFDASGYVNYVGPGYFEQYAGYNPYGDGTPPMRDTVLPEQFWPSQEDYDYIANQMRARGITPPPRGTLSNTATQELGRALYEESLAESRSSFGFGSPGSVAALVMGGAAAGGAFANGGAGYGVPAASDGLTPITAGLGNPAAVTLPGGNAAVEAAIASSGATPALSQLPSAIATPGAINALTGVAPAVISGPKLLNNLPEIISGASTLIGGKLASDSAEDAADAIAQGNREAIDYQRESRDIALGLIEPERQSANAAMARMLQMQGLPIPASLQAELDKSGVTLGAFNVADTPGYQFRLKESMDALEGSAFAKGNGMAGGFGEYALRYAQDYASTEYDKIYNQLATLTGRNTSTSGASVALNFGGNAANIASDTGAARASGYVAQGNAWQNALDQISQLPWDQWIKQRNKPAVAYGG